MGLLASIPRFLAAPMRRKKLAIEAVQGRDRELVLSITLVSGILTLAGNLVADICYAVADPRVSYE